MDSKKIFQSEIELMAKQLISVRKKKVKRVKVMLEQHSYGVKGPELARSLFVSP